MSVALLFPCYTSPQSRPSLDSAGSRPSKGGHVMGISGIITLVLG